MHALPPGEGVVHGILVYFVTSGPVPLFPKVFGVCNQHWLLEVKSNPAHVLCLLQAP